VTLTGCVGNTVLEYFLINIQVEQLKVK